MAALCSSEAAGFGCPLHYHGFRTGMAPFPHQARAARNSPLQTDLLSTPFQCTSVLRTRVQTSALTHFIQNSYFSPITESQQKGKIYSCNTLALLLLIRSDPTPPGFPYLFEDGYRTQQACTLLFSHSFFFFTDTTKQSVIHNHIRVRFPILRAQGTLIFKQITHFLLGLEI